MRQLPHPFLGCNAVINRFNGTLSSPAFGKPESNGYPPNQECIYTIRHPSGNRLSMMFTNLDLHTSDRVQVTHKSFNNQFCAFIKALRNFSCDGLI